MRSVPIGEVVRKYADEHKLERRRSVESMFDRWHEVIGPPESEMAAPLSLNDGTLVVAVANSTIASEVSFSQSTYLDRVNRYFGSKVAHRVRARIASGQERQELRRKGDAPQRGRSSESLNLDGIGLSADELDWVEKTVSRVQNEKTRARLRRALMTRLRREKLDGQEGDGAGPSESG